MLLLTLYPLFLSLSLSLRKAFTLFLIIVMMLIALVGMISTVEKTDMYTSPLFLQSIVIVFLFVLDMAAISLLGSRANEELRKHW